MGWIECFRCEKFRHDFMARTFALVRNVLARVSQGNQMVANAPKRYEMHQNMSLGSNGWIGFVRRDKLRHDFVARTFARSARSAPSFVRHPTGLKCTQMVQNAPKHEFLVTWGGSGAFITKNSNSTSWHKLLH